MSSLSTATTVLTDLAVQALNSPRDPLFDDPSIRMGQQTGDPLIDGLMDTNFDFHSLFGNPLVESAVDMLKTDKDLTQLVSMEGKDDPFISTAYGGGRQSLDTLMITSLLTAARRQLFIHGDPLTESAFARAVLSNFDQLKRAARGENIQTDYIVGLAGITWKGNTAVNLPWGTIRKIPDSSARHFATTNFRAPSTAVLICPQQTEVFISRSTQIPGSNIRTTDVYASNSRDTELTRLAFALATAGRDPCAPHVTMTSVINPFLSSFGYSTPLSTPWVHHRELTKKQLDDIEKWARLLRDKHHDNLATAGRRITRALSERNDRADVLIDAVTAWESLVGATTETTFRVTAAMSILLESNASRRKTLQKKLKDIYDIRSSVVHGAAVDNTKIQESASLAIQYAIRALRGIYERGGQWTSMTSRERADSLILGAK